eukprot:COSAG05_NODE_8686_length_680_cov_1.750430_2_plen_41_part_01
MCKPSQLNSFSKNKLDLGEKKITRAYTIEEEKERRGGGGGG